MYVGGVKGLAGWLGHWTSLWYSVVNPPITRLAWNSILVYGLNICMKSLVSFSFSFSSRALITNTIVVCHLIILSFVVTWTCVALFSGCRLYHMLHCFHLPRNIHSAAFCIVVSHINSVSCSITSWKIVLVVVNQKSMTPTFTADIFLHFDVMLETNASN